MYRAGLLALLSTLIAAPVASAEPPRAEVAPPPDQADGVARPDEPPAGRRWRRIPRTVLFVPKWIVWGIGQPIRGAAYVYERYDLRERMLDVFFDPSRVFGVYPTATYETDFGVTGGARLVHRDLFGARERVRLRADFGGRYRQAYGVELRSGRRLGARLAVELDASWERRPRERYFGIGNAQAIDLRFHEDVSRNVGTVDIAAVGDLHARLAAAFMFRRFPEMIEGWSAVDNAYTELAFVYDSRRSSAYQSRAFDSTGWYLNAHGGVARGLADDPTRYFAYGAEAQRYLDLYDGSRVLVLRALVDEVRGDDDRIAFIDLPRLGGTELLRGYPTGRFRDRAIALGTVEYAWDLGNYLAAYTFVDVGRPLSALDQMFAPGPLRVGYGGGVQVHTSSSYLLRVQLAASRDGHFALDLALSPAFGRRERAGRF